MTKRLFLIFGVILIAIISFSSNTYSESTQETNVTEAKEVLFKTKFANTFKADLLNLLDEFDYVTVTKDDYGDNKAMYWIWFTEKEPKYKTKNKNKPDYLIIDGSSVNFIMLYGGGGQLYIYNRRVESILPQDHLSWTVTLKTKELQKEFH